MNKILEQIKAKQKLIAHELENDPRIAEAKKLLLDTVDDYRSKITGIRPPSAELKASYQEIIEAFNEIRGGKLWYPYIGSGIGNGALVELLDGSIKYDFISGIGPHYWGHSHHDIIDTGIDAAISNTVMQGHLQQNADSIVFSEMLVKASGLNHCFLTTSGAMANENALKIALQKNYPAHRILAFDHCFAGRTLAISQITDKPAYRKGLPSNLQVDYIPFFDETRPKESTKEAVAALKHLLERYPKQHAVMIMEMIQGEGGFYPGSHDFFSTIMRILKEHHIAIFADEVQTFGRTSQLFAYQHFKLQEYIDIATIGKLSQVCATLFTKEYRPQSGLLSQTFTGSTSVIRAATVILNSLLTEGYFGLNGHIEATHRYFVEKFNELANKYPERFEGPYGIGSMIAFTPHGGDPAKVLQFSHDLYDAGVISFIAGSHTKRIRFLIPVGAIKRQDIDNVVAIIEKVLNRS